jgi:hypothetical protein
MSVNVYYTWESVVFCIAAWTFVVLYALQIRAHKVGVDDMARVQSPFHYSGFACSLLLAIAAIDPQAVLNRLPWIAVLYLKDLATCSGYFPISLWVFTLVLVAHGSSGKVRTGCMLSLSLHHSRVCKVASIINLVICIVFDTVSVLTGTTMWRGIFLLYMSTSCLLASLLMLRTVLEYTRKRRTTVSTRSVNAQISGTSQESCLSKETGKLRYTALCILFISLLELWTAITNLATPQTLQADQIPADPQEITVYYFIVAYWTGLLVGLRSSWLPICGNGTKSPIMLSSNN